MSNNMAADTWKEFKENELTHSMAHYLMAVRDLIDESGYARIVDISRRLNIARSSASIGLKALVEKGLIAEDTNKFLHLTEQGRCLADGIVGKKIVLKRFFEDILNISPDLAEVDACKIEHLVSIETISRMLCMVKYFQSENTDAAKVLVSFRNEQNGCEGKTNCSVCIDTCLKDLVCECHGEKE